MPRCRPQAMNEPNTTGDRATALGYLRAWFPNASIEDTEESAGPLLDLIEAGQFLAVDPASTDRKLLVVAGPEWKSMTPAGQKAARRVYSAFSHIADPAGSFFRVL